MRSDDAERITLRVAGREHRDWTRYQVDSDLITPADAWRVEMGIPADRVPGYVRPWADVELLLGSDVVLTGRIDRIERTVAKGEHTLSLSGRDMAAVLVDCSAPLTTRREVELADAVALLVAPLGLSRTRVEAQGRKKKVEVEPGMTAWDALKRLCEANGCWAWCEPDGTLVVGGPDYAAPPVAELVLRAGGKEGNVKRLSVIDDVSGRHSEVSVLGQTFGTEAQDGQHNLQAVERDNGVHGYRPLILHDSDVDSQEEATRRARKAIADSRLEGFTVTAEVRGHRAGGGEPWRPGQRVRLVSEPHGLDATYYLMKRTFLGGRDRGTITELTLKEDGVWLPDLAASSTKNKGSKTLRVVDL